MVEEEIIVCLGRRKLGIKVWRDTRQSYGHQVTINLDDHSVREKVSQPREGYVE